VRVCLSSRTKDRLNAAAEKITAEIPTADVHTFTCDMRKLDDVEALCNTIASNIGNPDILVNNTGGPKPGGFFDLSVGDWEEGYRLMVGSTVVLYQKLIPSMMEKGWGRIVNITSVSSRQPVHGLTLSNSFRPGLLGLVKSVAEVVGTDGVLINTVMPGLTMTDRVREIHDSGESDAIERLKNQIPLKRIADPAEQGNVVAFLCSDKASFVTGSAIAVDGGSIRGL
jgi:3-oxoacyl-[acyl-carrier protein] reductase